MKRLLLALLSSCVLSAGASASNLPACSLGETDWRRDPVLLEHRHPSQRQLPIRTLTCQTVESIVHPIDGGRLQVLRAKVFEATGEGEGIQQAVNLVVLSRLSGEDATVLARFLVPYDVSRDAPSFFPTVHQVGGDILVHMGDQVAAAYRITGDRVTAFDSHAWAVGARAAAGIGWTVGRVRKVDFAQMVGFLSLYRTGSDDPATPGSAYDRGGRVVRAQLAFDGDRLVGRDAAVVDHGVMQDVEETTEIIESETEAERARRRLPAGTEPCSISGWSMDSDPAGLNVRAEPSARGRVVGKVPPAWNAAGRDGDEGTNYRAEFDIAGYRDGWFFIRNIRAPGADYGERYPRSRPQPYRGHGWVSARLVGAALANGGLPGGRLMQAPNRHAADREVARSGEPIATGDIVQRLHACSGHWGLVEMEGVRGWWKGICSNQVTNCS